MYIKFTCIVFNQSVLFKKNKKIKINKIIIKKLIERKLQ